ncbi:helix-turn-helix domain-containing protein [Aestuariibius insulae]|uniref:helix-turn-helix domain-containing protein n=1 Tax=Aestuariibius insulae TaxID=2058287 RepID=UPI00345EFBBE
MTEVESWYSAEAATFGDRVAGAREAAGLDQQELAKRLGIKLSTLRNWEEDLNEPRANKLQMLSGLLGVSLTWLMTGKGDGLDAPEQDAVGSDMKDVLIEMRQLKTVIDGASDQLSRLEKRLRKRLAEQG